MSKRLGKIVDLIPKKVKKIIDLGCDHCLLSILIRKRGINAKIIASDINSKPLEKGQRNCQKENLKEIDFVLSDGLKNIVDDYDCLIIAGLGGKEICKILNNTDHMFSNKTIILQANNNLQMVRSFVKNKKLCIEKELIINENNIYYFIIKISAKGNKVITKKDLKFGFGHLIKTQNNDLLNYWISKKNYIEKISKQINDNSKIKFFDNELKVINKFLKFIKS